MASARNDIVRDSLCPDRCLICHTIVKKVQKCDRSGRSTGKCRSTKFLDRQLENIFILRNVLEIPPQNLQVYLMNMNGPETWISLCQKCRTVIDEAKSCHFEMITALKRFKEVKERVVKRVRLSNASKKTCIDFWKSPNNFMTEQSRNFVSIHQYGNFTDPFIEGDKKAKLLAVPTLPDLSAVVIPKTEVSDFTDDFEFDDIAHLSSEEVTEDHAEEDIPDNDPKMTSNMETVDDPLSNPCVEMTFGETGIPMKFCSICKVNFTVKVYEDHKQYLHKTEISEHLVLSQIKTDERETAASDIMLCSKCPRKFRLQHDLSYHLELHKSSPFHCYICMAVFKSPENLRTHVYCTHPATRSKTRGKCSGKNLRTVKTKGPDHLKNIKCSKCTRYIRPGAMKEHLELHERSPHCCKICGNVFKNQRDLVNHLANYHRSAYLEFKEEIRRTKKRKSSISKCKVKRRHISSDNSEDIDDIRGTDKDWIPNGVSTLSGSIKTERNQRKTVTNDGKLLIDCPMCGNTRFKIVNGESRKLLKHLENCQVFNLENHEMESFTCPVCNDRSFTALEKFAGFEHLLSCDGNGTSGNHRVPLSGRIFDCNACPSTRYFQLDDFIKHYKDHSKNMYKCSKCPQRFPITSQVLHHWKKHHKEAMKNVQPLFRFTKNFTIPEVTWWCPFCNEKFTNENSRDSHIENAHNEHENIDKRNITCVKCSNTYYCKEELKLHEATVHGKRSGNLLQCDMCYTYVMTQNQLQKHRMKKHRVDLLICDTCGIECNSPSTLSAHMQLHQDKKKFACDLCDQSFTTKQYLRNHKYREHTERDPKVNPLCCPYCKNIFNNKSYLRHHIAGTHKGNWNFRCHICSRGFQHQSHLTRHNAVKHKTGEFKKNYVCTMEGCVAAFDCRSKLKTHLSKHTRESSV